ncbi:MAG: glycosyl transferase family 2 [Clostridiales bacterium]|nr:glycosyl transferase family 2 [Clostridiales bacterium]
MKDKLKRVLNGDSENHILPFFWQHGEDDDTLIKELHRIHDSGISAVCVESRPHEGFARDAWWEDMALILEESERLGMEVWILDDKYFPTGFCNGILPEKHPELGKRAITERHMDVCGPLTDASVIYEGWADETKGDELKAIIACRCADEGQMLTGECIDITDKLHDGLVTFDFPQGIWRVFFIFERPEADGRVDFTNPESVNLMFEEIYEPHYTHLKKYFGKTFKGFFSDEPFIMNGSALPIKGESASHARYPWNKYIAEGMRKRLGDDYMLTLPSLWFTMTGLSQNYRVSYMDTVSTLYKESFCDRVGAWCRERGAMYIGHVVEDNNQHSNMGSGGHYFRALDGQDMAGVDVVLHQIVPGLTDHPNACNCWYDTADSDFFTYSLAKLAASHSHIQPEKHGRAMCEIYGAYGWAEGLKMMKWLTDHMLVRGINNFVPHAFSAKFPDEVPPQFTGAEHNPQFRQFKLLMEYMNRVSTIMSDGIHHASAAILYHAEAEWSGGDFMYFYTPARLLTKDHIDFDIISADYLEMAGFENGRMCLGDETYPCIIVPMSEYLSERVTARLEEAALAGIDVVFVDKITEKTCEHPSERIKWHKCGHIHEIASDFLTLWMRAKGYYDITSYSEAENLRFYHYSCGDTHAYMLTNEGICDDIVTTLTFDAFEGGDFAAYFPMENKAYLLKDHDRAVHTKLAPYESVIYFFGDIPKGLPVFRKVKTDSILTIEPHYNISLYSAENYPESPITSFESDSLMNITSRDMYPRFGGYMKYEGKFDVSDSSGTNILDLGEVGESAELFINGKKVGDRIAPPYKFDVTGFLRDGENDFTVVVANHLGYEQRDLCSKFLVMERSGLIGPVTLKKMTEVND